MSKIENKFSPSLLISALVSDRIQTCSDIAHSAKQPNVCHMEQIRTSFIGLQSGNMARVPDLIVDIWLRMCCSWEMREWQFETFRIFSFPL
jgi:hypothetical protein